MQAWGSVATATEWGARACIASPFVVCLEPIGIQGYHASLKQLTFAPCNAYAFAIIHTPLFTPLSLLCLPACHSCWPDVLAYLCSFSAVRIHACFICLLRSFFCCLPFHLSFTQLTLLPTYPLSLSTPPYPLEPALHLERSCQMSYTYRFSCFHL